MYWTARIFKLNINKIDLIICLNTDPINKFRNNPVLLNITSDSYFNIKIDCDLKSKEMPLKNGPQ